MEKAHGADHVSTREARNNFIIVMTSLEIRREAERQAEKLVASLDKICGENQLDIIDAVELLADTLSGQGKHERPEPLYNRVLLYNRGHRSKDDEAPLRAMASVVQVLRKLEGFDAASTLNQERLDIPTETLGPNHVTTFQTTALVADILHERKCYTEAATLQLQIISARTSSLGHTDPKTLEAKENLS
ncbi:MAG: hypothetical protein Q9224_003427 [Gallowayella concinna]